MKVFYSIIIFSIISGCASAQPVFIPRKIQRTPISHLNPKLQIILIKRLHPDIVKNIKDGTYEKTYPTCGNLVYDGIKYSSGTVIEDDSETYYDNFSGKAIAECGFWSKNRKNCPPKGWTCDGS